MGFSKMIEFLQKKNKGKIVLCNLGNFYVGIGKDAVLLNKILDLKVSCFKPEICKVGFPINSLEKYTDLIQQAGYSYIVYYFNKEKSELEVLLEYQGKYKNENEVTQVNCYICSKNTKKYKKEDKYILAVAKLYEEDKEQERKQEQEEKEKRKRWFQNKNRKTN